MVSKASDDLPDPESPVDVLEVVLAGAPDDDLGVLLRRLSHAL